MTELPDIKVWCSCLSAVFNVRLEGRDILKTLQGMVFPTKLSVMTDEELKQAFKLATNKMVDEMKVLDAETAERKAKLLNFLNHRRCAGCILPEFLDAMRKLDDMMQEAA